MATPAPATEHFSTASVCVCVCVCLCVCVQAWQGGWSGAANYTSSGTHYSPEDFCRHVPSEVTTDRLLEKSPQTKSTRDKASRRLPEHPTPSCDPGARNLTGSSIVPKAHCIVRRAQSWDTEPLTLRTHPGSHPVLDPEEAAHSTRPCVKGAPPGVHAGQQVMHSEV